MHVQSLKPTWQEVPEEGEGKVVGLPTMKPPEVHHGYQNNKDRRAHCRDTLQLVHAHKEVREEGEGKVVGLSTMKPPEVHHSHQKNKDRRARDRDILRLVNKRQEMPTLKGQRIETWDTTLSECSTS